MCVGNQTASPESYCLLTVDDSGHNVKLSKHLPNIGKVFFEISPTHKPMDLSYYRDVVLVDTNQVRLGAFKGTPAQNFESCTCTT